jgi:hypothetical protein
MSLTSDLPIWTARSLDLLRPFISNIQRHSWGRWSRRWNKLGTRIACTNGMEAWDYLANTALPDRLITSIDLGSGMPPGTALGMQAHSSKVPVIYIPETAEKAEHADPDHGAVLVRPFDVRSLVEAAQRLM